MKFIYSIFINFILYHNKSLYLSERLIELSKTQKIIHIIIKKHLHEF